MVTDYSLPIYTIQMAGWLSEKQLLSQILKLDTVFMEGRKRIKNRTVEIDNEKFKTAVRLT